ncbi:sugar transferase [Vibrio kanaloae]|uniref:sugar transferase n=1 Tax=Vibrio kanaloae TaxID=170673 RepID=UPI001245F846|nr:sugar transferase [Vibrio kanaloae]KAB0460947.1 sugar transferase [Vibrio kanaloae]
MKNAFDYLFSFCGLLVLWPIIFLGWIFASWSTKSNGFFLQDRVGLNGTIFKVIKLKTMSDTPNHSSSVTALNVNRITACGSILRKYKIDELPQLINVLLGHMSFVGPRPDVPGYADKLIGDDRTILKVKPGITGYATLYFKYEEEILLSTKDASDFNNEVMFPLKVKLNCMYIRNKSTLFDIDIILQTVTGITLFNKKIMPLRSTKECLELLRTTNVKY